MLLIWNQTFRLLMNSVFTSNCGVCRSIFIFGCDSLAKKKKNRQMLSLAVATVSRVTRSHSRGTALPIRRCYSTMCRHSRGSCSPSWRPCRSTSALAPAPTTATPSSSYPLPCTASCPTVRSCHRVTSLKSTFEFWMITTVHLCESPLERQD